MPQETYPIRAYNTLDDEPFDDGHPMSSWAGREVVRNGRLIHAICRRNLLNKAYDLNRPYDLHDNRWTRIAIVPCEATPEVQTCTVRMRGVITLNRQVYFACQTRARFAQHGAGNFGRWTAITGTGLAQEWSITGTPLLAGQRDVVEVAAWCAMEPGNTLDVTGIVASTQPYGLTAVAPPGLAGVAVGWAIMIEEPVRNQELTHWRTIVSISGAAARVFPGWSAYVDWATEHDGSAATQWRARPAASLHLRSIAIDEDELTGSL